MSSSVKVIRFTAPASILLFFLTYFITVNIEAHILEFNTVWLSNNFALTVLGGAFASMLVVLLCEAQKYITAEFSTQQNIFYQALYLYQALFLMQQNILDYQKNPQISVPEILLDEPTRMIQAELNALQYADYTTLFGRGRFCSIHQNFCAETAMEIQSLLNGPYVVRIAINNATINCPQKCSTKKPITAIDEPLRTVLSVHLNKVSKALIAMNHYLENLDECCNHRFNWKKQRETIHASYINTFEAWNFEKEYQINF